MTPFYDLYPKDPAENLEWRYACRQRAITDLRFRKALIDACMTDLLFFMGFACWSYEPRAKVKVRPFIPWPHQEPVFLAIDKAIDDSGEEKTIDVIVDKSRAQGGTYGYLWVDLRRWLRDPMFSAGFVTRNESLVDSKTDSSTVLWKVAWAIEKLPFWLVPDGWDPQKHRNLGQHTFLNPANGALLSGYAAGQDVAAGGRATVFTIDEAGARDFIAGGKDYAVQESLHDVSNCIRMVSARYADAGVFHDACENPDTAKNSVHLVLDWKDNPIHGKNSYQIINEKPVARKQVDQPAVDAYHRENPDLRSRLERKGFKFEGRVRSPWYDMRCLRPTSTPRLIASQLDRDPRGAVGKVFTTELLDKAKKSCRAPIWQGTPIFDSEDLELTGLLPRSDGALKLWFRPGADDSPPLGPFTVGCDMASGSDGAYSSNSVASILDDRTGEQVGEYTVKGMPLIKFARVVVGLCLWLRKARLGWEDSGMSGPFAKEIMEVIYYGNVFYRDVPEIGMKRKSRKAGWGNRTNEDKANLFEQMALGMETGKLILRSDELIKECGEYEWEDGKIIHAPTKNHAAKEVNHGDRCIAAGVAWLVYSSEADGRVDFPEETSETPEYGSFLWREMRERNKVEEGSPEFGIRDVMSF
jgi:hypothetical protein